MKEIYPFKDSIICGDYEGVIKKIPDKSIDLILTDPPYNASGNFKVTYNGKKKIVDESWDYGFDPIEFLTHSKRVLKDSGSLLVFCSFHLLPIYLGFEDLKLKQILHWVKRNPLPAVSKVYTPSVEYCLWWVMSKSYTLNLRGVSKNVFNISLCMGKERTSHPTQKPLSLVRELVKNHSNKGDYVLDPFLGSGTTAVACKETERFFIGIEKEENYCKLSESRIQKTLRGSKNYGFKI